MTATFENLLPLAKNWAQRAAAEFWLPPGDLHNLERLQSHSPASLFEAGSHRPLVAALFGGTGVGKSSLLNRLAGQNIARTGVERPTSREVSLYLHASVQIQNLPGHFPLERVRMAQHHDDSLRQVLWIDMPDIDSIEQDNRHLVMEWLPHIDVLIYVVSPERYRDDKGWRLLQAHGGDHAWLFVLNQWDRGHPSQYEDFAALLGRGGFPDPVILRSDCRPDAAERKPDDFGKLQDFLRGMADHHVLRQLENRVESARLESLAAALAAGMEQMGNNGGYGDLRPAWSAIWEEVGNDLLKGMEWPIASVARTFVGREVNPLQRSVDLTREPAAANPEPPQALLWDDWTRSRLRDALDQLVVAAGERGLPALPLKTELDPLQERAGQWVLSAGQRGLRQALANPGNAFQRIGLRVAGALAIILPLAALGWATYQVVKGYYDSATLHLGYLGTDFAVHTLLLIGLAWLLPYFTYRQLKPSAERTAIKGLRDGLRKGLDSVGEAAAEELESLEARRQAVLDEGRRLIREAATLAPPPDSGSSDLLRRVLPDRSRSRVAGRF